MDSTGTLFLPPAGSTMAGEVDALFNFILWVSTGFLAIVVFGAIFFAMRYKRKGAAGLTSGVDHNLTLEIIWTVIPTILILIVFYWGFKDYVKMSVAPRDAIEIKVTGQKWFWTFDYPGGANAINELVVPANRPVKLLMSSTDVIHSLFIPNFRMKMDVLPNRYTTTWFEAIGEGEFDLYCTEFCGKGHSEMIGRVKVLSDSAYTAWIEASSTFGEGLTLEEYGAQLYKSKACITCHSLDGKKMDGPTFLGRTGTELLMSDGSRLMMDENYMRESILDPKAKIANGYQPVMPTFQGVLKDRQIDALIAFIKELNTPTDQQTQE